MSLEERKLIEATKSRLKKREEFESRGISCYNNNFKPSVSLGDIADQYKNVAPEDIPDIEFTIAGRIMFKRSFGKALFYKLSDKKGMLQVYCKKDNLDEQQFFVAKRADVGDILGIKGTLFITHTGELTLNANSITLLTKSLRPLPEKWHGLKDKELRYRKRYLDLIMNAESTAVFRKRAKIIKAIREFLDNNDFVEVETPVLQPVAGGATANPFITHHNALDIDLYLRIAPELYLKRIIVGGLERIYELSKNFRNEGMDLAHNPEFTMIEFYYAYQDYLGLMNFTEQLIGYAAKAIDAESINFSGNQIDFAKPWKRIGLYDAIVEIGEIDGEVIKNKDAAYEKAVQLGKPVSHSMVHAKLLEEIFDVAVEPKLINPTFITDFPVAVSPLARRSEKNPDFVDRFELYIGGMEIANAFSELSDPVDQRARLEEQAKAKEGEVDYDYIETLECGLPPTAGEGIGIDRLVMILTGSNSIRDVILFPQMRPKK
ncbi:MAG TPA: lysine--tRNA ligase [Deltaproteobacteria bacterium]|nr:lysine--tRNA ligase [Deltaproteobacteria bacterium]